jgi:hypothetical protein
MNGRVILIIDVLRLIGKNIIDSQTFHKRLPENAGQTVPLNIRVTQIAYALHSVLVRIEL